VMLCPCCVSQWRGRTHYAVCLPLEVVVGALSAALALGLALVGDGAGRTWLAGCAMEDLIGVPIQRYELRACACVFVCVFVCVCVHRPASQAKHIARPDMGAKRPFRHWSHALAPLFIA
jgi:hypothetical protein